MISCCVIISFPVRMSQDSDLTEGMEVKVNWQGKRVHAKILALNGKFTFHNFLKRF